MGNKSGANAQENDIKRLEWYGHVRGMKEEHIMRRMLDCGHTGEKK